jgi:2-polyprenyl-6-methoxyphenol hydroxylase-like FAD-dependent oxidoreductase
MSKQPLNVLISGAGIAGTTAALCLARHPNFILKPNITIIERSATPRTTGQAIDIRGPGVHCIRELGLEQRIKERHTGETGTAWVNSAGEHVAQFDMSGDAEKQSATSEYEILRGELAGLLLEELEIAKRDEGAEVEFICGEKIATLEEEDDGVAVTFANGMLEKRKFDVVIAADGVASKTRHMMFPTHYREDGTDVMKPWGMYIGYFTVPRIESDTDIWKWYNRPGGLSVHMRPHRNKKTMGVYLSLCESKCVRSPEVEEVLKQGVPAQKALLTERFEGAGWQVERFLKGMEEADDFYMSPIAMVVTQDWYVHFLLI